jgi:PEP-utilising enzyme, mobile domain
MASPTRRRLAVTTAPIFSSSWRSVCTQARAHHRPEDFTYNRGADTKAPRGFCDEERARRAGTAARTANAWPEGGSMTLYCDRDKYGYQSQFPVVEAYHAAIKDAVRAALAESGLNWQQFVFGASERYLTKDRIAAVERELLALGYRFDWSASVSARERPAVYKSATGLSGVDVADFMFDHPQAPRGELENGRQLCGVGDNVARYPQNVIGTARYIRSPEQVLAWLNDGVPDGTIALIDDSGGTLTAPIIQQFKGVICAGGSTRSHLGILTREYGVPCLMNSKLGGIRHGERVEIEVSAPAKTAAAYQQGVEMTASIWRLES